MEKNQQRKALQLKEKQGMERLILMSCCKYEEV
jgi:hypothetical protein